MKHKLRAKLTPYQSIFYYEWLQNPQRYDYNIIIDNTGYGEFDLDNGQKALAKLLNEHFILNSKVIEDDGELYWEIKDPIENPIKYFPNPLTDDEIYDIVTAPFDLHGGLLLKLHIINLGDNKFRQIIVVSHILVDGISTLEIRTKWSQLYNGKPYDKELAPTEKQLELHEELLNSFEQNLLKNEEKIHEFWKNRLKDISGVELDFLKNSNTKPLYSKDNKNQRLVSEYCFSYKDEIYTKVKNLKYDYKITPYIFGQLVLAILFNKLSGKDKLALAYPIAITEGQDLIYGAHVNTMVIDYRFDENKTLNSLIEATLKFYKDLKLSKARYLPVFDIARYADNAGVLNIGFAQTFFRDYGLDFNNIEDIKVNHEFQIDLVNELLFEQEDYEGSLNYRVRYYDDIIDSELLAQFIELYKKLFEELLNDLVNKNGDREISDIHLLTEQEEHRIVNEWNSLKDLSITNKSIVELFEERANRTPDNLAVVFNDQQLSYKELNERSNALAAYLKDNYRIESDDLVALYLNKSDLIPIAILGILKAGGAYVPMEPDAPDDRILYMLEDTRAKVIITNKEDQNKLTKLLRNKKIEILDISDEELNCKIREKYPTSNPSTPIDLSSLAYAIYTSGTTGKPKGVMLEHRGLTNLSLVQGEAFGLKNEFEARVQKRCLWYASYIFDAHVSEVFTALANGHCLHILDEDKRLDFKLLNEYISKNNIDVATIPPVLLDKNNLLKLSTLIVAGEVTNMEIMNNYRNQGVTIINAYGPTEGTVCSSLHYYEIGDKNTNIGRPLTNMTSYVLNSEMQPVPVGAIGELHIGGIGIARGYINNTELTQEKFISNPFQTEVDKTENYNGRLYKTGDRVRLLPNGEFEYIGRNDFQVKIRGFRIELGEIETRLSELPGIEQVVVLPKEHASGIKYLVGYYASREELDKNDIIEYLEKYLPDYMIPSSFMHLTAFPMTVNGKLDRKSLPDPEFTDRKNYIAPTNEEERSLCKIFGQILNINEDDISIEDDFFKLGGDSISSIQLVGKIRQQLQAQISMKDIFSLRSVQQLALKLLEDNSDTRIIKNEQGLLSGELRLLPIQSWFFHNVDQNIFNSYNHWNQTFMLNVPLLDVEILEKSIQILVKHHDALRLSYSKNTNGTYSQYYLNEVNTIPFSVLDTFSLSKDEINNILDEWQTRFNIFSSSPLFHLGYLAEKNSARLHFCFHHLVVDAISWYIIKNDLQTIYQYCLNNRDLDLTTIETQSVLGDKNTSYRQWASTIYEYKPTNSEIVFWQKTTENVSLTNHLLEALKTESDNRHSSSMDKSHTTKMLRDIHHVYGTQINDILLTALGYALKNLTGSNTHCITLEGHGRENIAESIDINNTVGWFTSMHPIELKCDSNDLVSCISTIKDTLNKIPNKGLTYGATFGYIKKELPKIGFNYLGQFDSSITASDWAFSSDYSGQAIASENKNTNILSLDCIIIDNELQIYAHSSINTEALSTFVENYISNLKEIINTLSSLDRKYLTLSDVDYIISAEHLCTLQSEKDVEAIYLANSLQQGFVYHAISQGNVDDAYRTQMLWDYHNPIEINLLKKAWELTQKKYPSLRLRFAWEEEIIQIIDKEGSLNWNYIDISDKKEDEQEIFVNTLLANDRQTEYDLQKGSLFRVYIIKRKEYFYNCIFSNHHAILDGWSNPILIKYIHEVYLNLLKQQSIETYADRVYGEAQKYLQNNKDENISYWTDYLKQLELQEDLSNILAADKKNINLSEHKLINQWGSKQFTISGNNYDKLKEIASANDITLNALVQYYWHKALSVFTDSETTVVGMVVSGRNLPVVDIEQSVGLFINTIPIVCTHSNAISLIDQVKALQNGINEGNHRSNINLSQLQTEAKRLFSSLFVFENYPIPENVFGDALSIDFKEAKEKQDYPLVITLFEQNNQLTFNLQYAEELFDNFIIEQIIDFISILLYQTIENPTIGVQELTYLNDLEYKKIIEDWNDTQVPYNGDKTVTELFEKQAEATPERLAVRYNNTELSYKGLNRKANRLAAYLKQKYTINPNDLIGLYMDRSEQVLISILAVLKTGAAYLPIDPTMPDDRVAYMLRDAGVKCVLTNEHYKHRLLSLDYQTFIETVDNESQLSLFHAYPSINPKVKTKPNDLVYVMYTSGTTGNPKGVMIEHRYINSLIFNSNYVSINANDNLLSLSGYQFDGSTYDFFAALLNGASVTISTKDVFLDLNEFNNLLDRCDITNFFVTTALFNMLVDAELPNLKRIKYLLFGGELVSTDHVNRFNQIYNTTNLVHVYGPTETTTYATGYLTNKHQGKFINNVPIGYPLQNTTLYVLDKYLRPVPISALGELYIGGLGVSRGYLNNSELTKERFLTNPFQTEAQKAIGYNDFIYKSGDIVRYIPNGAIEYIGRNDFQVKIRGFRIELGEIEAKMAQYPEIKQAVVLAYEVAGMKHLAGYYVSKESVDNELFRNYLAEILPDYMIPSALIHLEFLPLNINGKLDRKALPEPDLSGNMEYVAPTSVIEQKLCELYSIVLGIDANKISIEDDFFRLGGNSILAIKLASRINKAFDTEMHISSIFIYKTIKALATHLEAGNLQSVKISADPVNNAEEQLLSFAQERLWFIESYEEGSNAYNIPLIFRLNNNTDTQLMYNALNSILERHEVLRSLIKTNKKGIGYQVVCSIEDHPLSMAINSYDSLADMENDIKVSASRVFKLDEEYPIHVTVCECNECRCMSIVIHHIAFDGWSTDLFIKELYNYYQYHLLLAESKKEQAEAYQLPIISVQYKDFAIWQRNFLKGDILEKQLMFWKDQLSDYETLNLSTDKNRPAHIDYQGHDVTFNIDKQTSSQLREMAKDLNVSLYSLCLSAYYILLSAFSNQNDIVVGTPISGRNHQDIQETMGFFVNMLALRCRIDKNQSIKDFVKNTGSLINEAQLHQDLPFEKLVDALSLEKDASRHPVFQVVFGMQSFGSDLENINELITPYRMTSNKEYEVAKYDITVMLDDSNEVITGLFNYATALFDETTILGYIETYKHILEQLILNNKKRLSDINYLNDSEYNKIIYQWNNTRCSYPKNKTMIEMFEEQANKTPDNIAVVYEDVKLSYKELNEKANLLGAYLKETYDIQSNDLIALCLERSEYMLIAILAVLKSGGAYVPMAPDAPSERLTYMVNDTNAKVIIADESKHTYLSELLKKQVIAVDNKDFNTQLKTTYSLDNFKTTTTPNDLAYVIYTSGTTGNPKGVMVQNQGMVNFIISMISRIGFQSSYNGGPLKNGLWHSNYIFDAHIFDLFSPIIIGHTLHILKEDKRYELELINKYIIQHNIDYTFITPAILNKDYLLDLKILSVGGEAANLEIFKNYRAKGVKVVNVYGPTENSVGATAKIFDIRDLNTNLGQPISNVTTYILNEDMQLLPIGAIGELYLGGDGVARGYLNNTELTKERFIPNPFQTQEEKNIGCNDRIYKSGDLVKYLPNGDIIYLGRNDFQVKIRGYRIELGEIESQMMEIEGIKQAVVMALSYASGSKYLVGYYVSDNELNINDIRNYLLNSLPDYMVPSVFLHLQALPMTVNGKLNRKALPIPELLEKDNYIAPTTDIEKALCKIFSEILSLDESVIGINDDFFKLGGDSISSIQLVNRLRTNLNARCSVKDIFNFSTIDELANYIIAENKANVVSILSEQGILTGKVDLLPIQEWFFDNVNKKSLASYNHWNQSFLVKVPKLNKEILKMALNKLVDYHDSFRLCYRIENKEYIQYYNDKITAIPFHCADISNYSALEIESLLTIWQSDFNIFDEKLFHIGYLEGYEDGTARLHFALHHLIVDAVSWRIINNDIRTVYQYIIDNPETSAEEPVENILGKKGTSYRQWVEKITSDYSKSDSDAGEDEFELWENITSNIEVENQFFGKLKADNISTGKLVLNKSLTNSLLRDIHSVYNTQINDVLLTALSFALKDLTSQETHHILLEGHGREDIFNDIDINNTVGWFTSMYPIQLQADCCPITQALSATKDNLRKIPNNGIGYGALVGYIKKELPSISFNYLGQFDIKENNDLWTFSSDSPGQLIAEGNNLNKFLSINGGVFEEQLQLSVEAFLTQDQTEAFVLSFQHHLESLIRSLLDEKRSYLTLSDTDFLVSENHLTKLQQNREVSGIYLANSLQQGFIYHGISQKEDDAYITQMQWNYNTSIDVNKLKKAWELALVKYPALRLRFSWEDELLQIIDKESPLNWNSIDISDKSKNEQDVFLDELLSKDRKTPYNLNEGSLLRIYLVRLANDSYSCIFSNHHAILDGWSGPLLINYIHTTYMDLMKQKQISVITDKCYAASQKYLQNHKQENIEFWKNYLTLIDTHEDLSTLLKTEMKDINLVEYKAIKEPNEMSITISGDEYKMIKSICANNGFTLNALLQYCWHKQLNVYGGTNTTVIGMTVAGRSLPIEGIEESVGLYINTLPVILEHKDENIVELVKTLQGYINEINSKSDVSLAQLHENGTRMFNSLFVFENYPISGQTGDMDALKMEFKYSKEKLDYPLGVSAYEKDDLAVFKIQYAGELFDVEIIKQLLNGVSVTLEQVSNNPSIEARNLCLLTPDQYEQVVYKWNETYKAFDEEKTFIQVFEEQVERTPDNVAIVYRDVKLTYKELNEKVNILGAYLKETYAVVPNEKIALYLDKSEHMLISILAVQKSGAAYVPINPDAPTERIQFMVDDIKAKAVLTTSAKIDGVKSILSDRDLNILAIDDIEFLERISTIYPINNPSLNITSSDLVYIIYTSGTTGNPKGVMLEHRGLVNMCTMQNDKTGLYTCDKDSLQKNCLWYASYVFDAHAFELYNAIANGHCIHILEEKSRFNISLLGKYIKDNSIKIAAIPPALLDKDELLDLETLVVAGEVTSLSTMVNYKKSGVRVINAYGPTEDTVWSTCHTFEIGDSNTNIGQPIANTTLYVLNEYLNPVPVGALGELYIGGAGIARGYLNNEDLTRERFILNPFQTSEQKVIGYNDRIYKSGDIVRYLPNGDIEYIGRNDFQVKIRGFRIELGEIETRMSLYPNIKQAVALAFDQSGFKTLVGYYVSDEPIDNEALRIYLAEVLPDYMIPSAFIHLEFLPLTVNGKLDRKALPKPDLTSNEIYVAPANDTEQKLCGLYSKVLSLDVEKISVEDDFFRLGGNSILAIKLVGHINKAFDVDMHISSIFTQRTIRNLSNYLDSGNIQAVKIVSEIVSYPEEQLLSFAQERLWFIESYEEGSNAYNIPMIFQLKENVDVNLIFRSIESIIERHEVLRSFISTNMDGIGYQYVNKPKDIPLSININSYSSIQELEKAITTTIGRVFSLDREFPIHAAVYELDETYYMSIVVHHIAFDGWSTDLLIRELHSYYNYHLLCSRGEIDKAQSYLLPPLQIQYKDFALWQRKYLQGETLNKQLNYWKDHLDGYESLNLPTDYARPSHIDYSGHDIDFQLDKETSNNLRTLAKELNVSLYSLCLGAYYLLLSSFSNQSDIVLGTPIAGRNYNEIQDTIGFFVNMLALRANIDRNKSIEEFIASVGSQMNNSQLYQDLPFEKLVEVLNVEKDASRHPVFQVIFGMQSFGTDLTEIQDLLSPYRMTTIPGYEAAKFDLTVMLEDSGDCIKGVFNYATSLFASDTIERYIRTYKHILKQFSIEIKNQPLSVISYLDETDYKKIIFDWNHTAYPYPKDKTIAEMFEDQVEKTPENIALIYENVSLTYKELNERANLLGAYLKETYSIQPDDMIALCLERSEYMLISILAILKSGGAYVPMDPAAPNDRLAYMIEDTKAKIVITSKAKINDLVEMTKTSVIAIDDQDLLDSISKIYSKQNFSVDTKPQNLAYVIYTSGTTGNPKGVMIQNQSVINRIKWMHDKYPITENDRILQKTTYTFDVSVWELFWANWYGACIVLAHHENFKDNVYLSRLIEDKGVTVLHFVPSMLVAFVEGLEADRELQTCVQGLKYLFCSGEALNLYEVHKFHSLVPNCEIHNLYGPTEATVDVLYYDCCDKNISEILIGKPIYNTSAYILNNNMQPLPIGAIGELYIGGDNVARGYLNNTPLTQERFIPNPFQTEKEKNIGYNSYIYKTGDLAIYKDCGDIKYLGRNDFQVKIRGFRIELGEIETRMTEIEEIKQAVALVLDLSAESKLLIGYYVSDTIIDEALIQNHLALHLPEYMIPSIFVHIQKLPINKNGKLDRKALPLPQRDNQNAYVAPETKTEKLLVDVISEILGIPTSYISVDDDFFKLGGNSIMAIRLSYKISKMFNIRLKLVDILDTRKIRKLAQIVDKYENKFNPIVKLNHAPNKDTLFMVHPSMGGCDIYIPLAKKITPYYQCFGVDSYNLYSPSKISNLSNLASYYLSHILDSKIGSDKFTLLGWSFGGQIALEIAAKLEAMGKKNITIYLLDTWITGDEIILTEGTTIEDVMDNFNVPLADRDRVRQLIEVENKITAQSISQKLKYTNIVLFKAMKNDKHDLFNKYPKNNIDKQVEVEHQLHIIEVDCTHMDIIKQEDFISKMLSFSVETV